MRPHLIATVAAAALVAAGCGGGDEPRAAASPTPTATATPAASSKQAYEKAWDSLVGKWRREAREIVPETRGNTPTEQAGVLSATAGVLRTMADDLRRLEPPAQIRGAHDRYIAGLEALIGRVEGAVDAAVRGNPRPVRRLMSGGGMARGAKRLASARREFEQKGYDLPMAPLPGR